MPFENFTIGTSRWDRPADVFALVARLEKNTKSLHPADDSQAKIHEC
jgi:hypothetical protein